MSESEQPQNDSQKQQAEHTENKPDEGAKEGDKQQEAKRENIDDVKGVSAVAYLGILFFIPMVTNPKSKFAMFHANQGLLLLLAGIILNIAVTLLGFVTFGLGFLLSPIVWIFLLILFIMGLINALNGKMQRLPLIGQWDLIKSQS